MISIVVAVFQIVHEVFVFLEFSCINIADQLIGTVEGGIHGFVVNQPGFMRIRQLVEAGKLTQAEYEEITGDVYGS